MVEKTDTEVENEIELEDDEVTMRELSKIADKVMENIETEHDYPSNHPELGRKVPVLDLAMWVEKVQVFSSRMDCQDVHSRCKDTVEPCLPFGESSQGLDP